MSEILDFVQLPEDARKLLSSDHSEYVSDYAKLLIIQQFAQMASQQIMVSLTREEVLKVEEYIRSHTQQEQNWFTHLWKHIKSPVKVPGFFNVREVSKLTGLSPQQVRRNCMNGKFKAEQVAGENSSWRIYPNQPQFTNLPNWNEFLQQRKEKFERAKQAAQIGKTIWQEQPTTGNDPEAED